MSAISLKHLRYFDALARHAHFGRAAEACSISQPALSLQMKELSEILGASLIERSSRSIRLTAFGEVFAERARMILRSVDELEDLARTARDPLAGRLRLGVIPTIAPYLLPTLIGNLSRLYPNLDFRLRETVTTRLLRELAEGKLDAAIIALPVSEPGLTEVALFSEHFVLVRRDEDAGKPVPNREMLATMRLLLLEEGHCFRDQALSFCAIEAKRPRELLDGSSLTTLVQMVAAGIGVTLIPEMAVPVETRSAAVSIARLRDPQPARHIGMVWRKSSPLAAQLSRISEVVRQSGAEAAAEAAQICLPSGRASL